MNAMALALEEIVIDEFPAELELFRRDADELTELAQRGHDIRWMYTSRHAVGNEFADYLAPPAGTMMFAVLLHACQLAAREMSSSDWSVAELERRLVQAGLPAELVQRHGDRLVAAIAS